MPSRCAAPDGSWLVEPLFGEAGTIIAMIDLAARSEQQHDLDVAGHYARPDVLQLSVDRRRQGSGVAFRDS